MRNLEITRLPSGNLLVSTRQYPVVYIYRAAMRWRAYAYYQDGMYGKPRLVPINNRRTLLRLVRMIDW